LRHGVRLSLYTLQLYYYNQGNVGTR